MSVSASTRLVKVVVYLRHTKLDTRISTRALHCVGVPARGGAGLQRQDGEERCEDEGKRRQGGDGEGLAAEGNGGLVVRVSTSGRGLRGAEEDNGAVGNQGGSCAAVLVRALLDDMCLKSVCVWICILSGRLFVCLWFGEGTHERAQR